MASEIANGKNSAELQRYMTFLSICHTIVVAVVDGKPQYNAASPDELALVNFAKQMGYNFKDRDINDNCVVGLPDGSEASYKLLNILEFNSTRKRMSCIFKVNEGK